MATVHVGANTDPHPSIILVPPGRGWSGGWLARKDSNLNPLIQSQVPCRLATRHRGPRASTSSGRAAAHLNESVPAPWPTCP